jgi:WhiB family redox-sensing transcriptional regulator
MDKCTYKAPAFDGTQPCRKVDLETFFPTDRIEEASAARQIKAICRTCDFNAACLTWALENRERGIWAGTTEDERKNISRRSKRQFT